MRAQYDDTFDYICIEQQPYLALALLDGMAVLDVLTEEINEDPQPTVKRFNGMPTVLGMVAYNIGHRAAKQIALANSAVIATLTRLEDRGEL